MYVCTRCRCRFELKHAKMLLIESEIFFACPNCCNRTLKITYDIKDHQKNKPIFKIKSKNEMIIVDHA